PSMYFLIPLEGTGEWCGDWLRDLEPPTPDVQPVVLAVTDRRRRYEIGLANWKQHCPPTHERLWELHSEEQRAMRIRQWDRVLETWRQNPLTTKGSKPES
ncbi:MAG: hypothetical protein LC620_04295, partial [Halobacteriales archaeon]|nr:hypothetical protein [Halobacteriales archaeon]